MPEDIQKLVASGVLLYIVFLFSTVLHEAAHAWAAALGGDKTAYKGGQVSLNPIPHIRRETFGMVWFPLITLVLYKGAWLLGYASAPYNPMWAHQFPRRAALMALAGPVANLLIVVATGAVLYYGVHEGAIDKAYRQGFLTPFEAYKNEELWRKSLFILNPLFSLNLLLFLINLVPLPPFDGSAVLMLFMTKKQAQKYQRFIQKGTFGMAGMILVYFTAAKLLWPAMNFAVDLIAKP